MNLGLISQSYLQSLERTLTEFLEDSETCELDATEIAMFQSWLYNLGTMKARAISRGDTRGWMDV